MEILHKGWFFSSILYIRHDATSNVSQKTIEIESERSVKYFILFFRIANLIKNFNFDFTPKLRKRTFFEYW